VSSRKKPLANKKPKGAPSCGHIAANARFPGFAVSVTKSAAPDHSPPRPSPWQKRMIVNSAGAHNPIVKVGGEQANYKRGNPHRQQGTNQRCLPANPITHVAKDD